MAMTKIYYKGYIIKSGGRNIPPDEYWIIDSKWSTSEPIWIATSMKEVEEWINSDIEDKRR